MRNRLFAVIALLIAVMGVLAWIRWSIWSYGADTGIFAQSIFNAFRGFTNAVEPGGNHIRTHWSPIIAVLWPLVAITRTPLSIQIAQAALIALTAVPLYNLIEPYAGERWALRCSILALLYPPLLANAFVEFHELAFYPVVILTLIWAADRGRWGWYAGSAFAAACIREDVCLDLAVAGLALAFAAWRYRGSTPRGLLYGEPVQRKATMFAGFAVAALAGAVLAAYALLILPRLGRWTPVHFYAYPFAEGAGVAASVFTGARITFLLELLLPLALLPLFSRWTLLAIPALAEILLANNGIVYRMGWHYVLLAVPWVILGACAALVKIVNAGRRPAAIRWWRWGIAGCAVFLIAFDPMHPVHYLRAEPYQHSADVELAMSCVPRDAAIETHDEWLTHYAIEYRGVTQFAKKPDRFPGYIVFAQDWQNPHFTRVVLPKIRAAESEGRYRSICRYGDVVVLRPSLRTISASIHAAAPRR